MQWKIGTEAYDKQMEQRHIIQGYDFYIILLSEILKFLEEEIT